MDQEVQKDLVEKILESLSRRSDFCGGRWPSSPISEGSVWVIDPIDGTNNFVTQKGRFCCYGGLF
ncbi:MAG: inositol monophosphatase family protein [Streptococcus sp.]